MKKFRIIITSIKVFIATIIFFVFINILISLSWYVYTSVKSNKNLFPEEVRNNFTLSEKNQIELYNEAQTIRYKYEPFVGPITDNFDGKFVNYNTNTGRFVENIQPCKEKIFFFGGSTTFGWLSTDENTIPSQFKKILDLKKKGKKNSCVYNFGQPWFYSKQENNYLLNFIEKDFKPDVAIFLNGINEVCHGHALDNNIIEQFNDMNVKHTTFIVLKKLKRTLDSLPIFQLALRLSNERKFRADDDGYDYACEKTDYLSKLFEERIKMRNEICKIYNINCYTFLQPFGLNHGNFYFTNEIDQKRLKMTYQILQGTKGIIDISTALDGKSNKISYVDDVHYSHESNKFIAEAIFQKIY